MDSLEGLTNHINSYGPLWEMLEIDYEVCNGVWKTVMNDFYVAADYGLTWGDVLNRPSIDVMDTWDWGNFKPTKEDWEVWHKAHRELLSMDLANAVSYLIPQERIRYSIRKKGPKAKLYKVVIA